MGKHIKPPTLVPDGVVARILALYKPEYRNVSNVHISEHKLYCNIHASAYPYTTTQLFDYITAPSATFYACQLGYVLIGALAIYHDQNTLFPTHIDIESILRLRDNALIRVSNVDTHFQKEVRLDCAIHSSMELISTRRLGVNTHCSFDFQIGDGITGHLKAVIMENDGADKQPEK